MNIHPTNLSQHELGLLYDVKRRLEFERMQASLAECNLIKHDQDLSTAVDPLATEICAGRLAQSKTVLEKAARNVATLEKITALATTLE